MKTRHIVSTLMAALCALAFVSCLQAQTVDSGTYTPTITLTYNLADGTANPCQYIRVDSVVTVSCVVWDLETSGAAPAQFTLTLPVTPAFHDNRSCAGAGSVDHYPFAPVRVLGGTPALPVCVFTWAAPGAAMGKTASVTFTYSTE